MTDSERYDRALRFASEKHRGQMRVGGEEYITHPIAVAEIIRKNGGNTDYQIIAAKIIHSKFAQIRRRYFVNIFRSAQRIARIRMLSVHFFGKFQFQNP